MKTIFYLDRCYVDNGVSNSTETIKLSLNIKYRFNTLNTYVSLR